MLFQSGGLGGASKQPGKWNILLLHDSMNPEAHCHASSDRKRAALAVGWGGDYITDMKMSSRWMALLFLSNKTSSNFF